MRNAWLAGVAVLAASTAAPARAQGDEQAARARAAELLAKLSGHDEGLRGTSWFGLYLSGRKSIGTLRLTVGPQKESSGYVAELTVAMRFGANAVDRSSRSVLGSDLSIVEHSAQERSRMDDEQLEERLELKREGEEWVCTKHEGGRSASFRFPVQGPCHQDLSALLLLCRKLDLRQATSYRFTEVIWPAVPEEGEAAEAPRGSEVVLVVPAAAPFQHRGQEVQAHLVRAERGDEQPMTLALDGQGRLLAFWPDGSPIRMVAAANEEEARRDLAPPRVVEAGPGSPDGACAVYLQVLARQRQAKDLDAVVDWEAIHAGYQAAVPARVAGRSVADLRKEILEEMGGMEAPLIDPEQLPGYIELLEVQVEGERAKVSLPGLSEPFELRRVGEAWRITRFPG